MTIAIVDSYGSDTMAHDLHVFDQAFGLPPMCGEEGVTCAPACRRSASWRCRARRRRRRRRREQRHRPGGQERLGARGRARRRDVARDRARGRTSCSSRRRRAETLGVQGFPQMMKAEEYVVEQPPRRRDLAELRLGRGGVRQHEVAAEPALRVQGRRGERRHRARLVRRRRHGERRRSQPVEPGQRR